MPVGYADIQRKLKRLERWPDRNLKKFRKEKYKVLHLGKKNPGTSMSWGLMRWKAAFQERT